MRARKLMSLIIAPLFAVGMAACEVDETEEYEAPEVEVEEGQLPAYDVEATQDTVTIPDVDVEPEGEGGS